MTHAHFYKNGFDDVVTTDNWVIARQGDSYVALYSYQKLNWSEAPSEYVGREIIADGDENIWICHVANAEENTDDFQDFVANIIESQVNVSMERPDPLIGCLAQHECMGKMDTFVQCISILGKRIDNKLINANVILHKEIQ